LQERWDFRRQAERWAESGERTEWLARGAALEAAVAWPNLSALEQRFVKAGRRAEMLDRALRVGGLAVVIVGALLAVSMLWQVERVRRRQVAISSTAAQALIAEDKELEERIGWALKAYVDQDRLEDDRIAGLLEGLHLLTDSSIEADAAEGLSVEAALRSALKDAPAQVLHRFWNNAPAIKVQEIVASPDGRRLATLSLPEDSLGLVPALWDWQTGQQQVELRPEVVAPVTGESGLIFSDDGLILAGIGGDGAAYLWNTSDGTVLRSLPHDSDIARIWLGPTGSGWLASATYDQRLHLWDTRTGAELWILNTGVWPPQLAFSGDGRRIALAVEPGSLCLIDPSDTGASGEPVCVPVALPESAYLSDLIGCPRESCFYAALAYDRPQVCDDAGCLPIAEAPAAEGDLHFPAQAFCAKPLPAAGVTEDEPAAGNLLDSAEPGVAAQAMLAAYDDATIQTWDVTDPMSPTVTLSLFGPTGLQDALLRRDCAAVGTVGATGGILYDATTGAILAESPIEPGDARQLYNIGGGIGIASADRDDAIRLWGFARTGDSEPIWRGGELNGRSVSPDGRWAATMTGNEVTLVNLRTRESRPLQLGAAVEDAVLSDTAEGIRLGPGGRLLLWRAFDGSIRLMETAHGRELSRLQDTPDLQATAMADDLVATVGEDGIVRLWDTADLAADASQPITFSQPITDVRALALSLDGKWLALVGRGMDDRLRVWDVEKKAPLTLPEITDVQALALNGDGTRLAVMQATPDGTILPARVTVWDTVLGQKAAEMSVANALPALAFDEGEAETDTSYLVVAHGGNGITTISRHFIAPQDLARRAAAVTGCRLETEPKQDRDVNKPACEALLVRRPRER
jgi:WD40 repeat protein